MTTAIEKIRAKNKSVKNEIEKKSTPEISASQIDAAAENFHLVENYAPEPPEAAPIALDPLSHLARPCLTCSLPIIWFSIYDRHLPPGATPTPHCPECSPPPAPALVDGMYHVVGVANAGLGAGLPTFADPTTLTAGRLTLQKFWPREGDVRDARPTATTTSPTTHPKITVTKSDRSAGSPGGGGEGKNREAATTKTLF